MYILELTCVVCTNQTGDYNDEGAGRPGIEIRWGQQACIVRQLLLCTWLSIECVLICLLYLIVIRKLCGTYVMFETIIIHIANK
jgi:hypothetical protein